MKRVSLALFGLSCAMLAACGASMPAPTASPTLAATDTPVSTPTLIPTLTSTPPLEATASHEAATGTIVFVSDETGHDQIYLINADGSDRRALTSGEGDNREPVWSPDGKRIAFTHIEGGQREDINGQSYITSIDSAEIIVVNADGTNPFHLTPALRDQGFASFSPAWSPDGNLIAFETAEAEQIGNSFAGWDIVVADVRAAGEMTPITEWAANSGVGCSSAVWLQDSRHLLAYCRALMNAGVVLYDSTRDVSQINPDEAETSPTVFESQGAHYFVESPSGVLAISEGTYIITARGTDYSNRERLPLDLPMLESGYSDAVVALAWSPTADRLAVRTTTALLLTKADGSRQSILARDLPTNDWISGLSWSPEGAMLALTAVIDGNAEIMLASPDGTSLIRLTETDANESDPQWQP